MRAKKPKMALWAKILIIALAVILVGTAVGVGIVYYKLSQIGEPEPVATVNPSDEYFETDPPKASDAVAVSPQDVIWPTGVEAITDKDVFNILLIGQDRREGESRQRSDTMIIASYSKKDGTVKLISLMRDMYVQIPGYSDNKLNAAYAFGGMELLDATIETNFGVTIDGNMEVDFDGFSGIIDLLGGVDIELNAAEAENMQDSGLSVTEGLNHLDGKAALAYARIRYVGNSDYERTERQRRILEKVAADVSGISTVKKIELINSLIPYLTTDMTQTEILSYAYTILTDGYNGLKSYRLPADDTFQSVYINEMAVLLPDLDKTRELLQGYIYG